MDVKRDVDGEPLRYGLIPDEAQQVSFGAGHGSLLQHPDRAELSPVGVFFQRCEERHIEPSQSPELVWVNAKSRELLVAALRLALTAPDGDVARIIDAQPPYRPDSIAFLEAKSIEALIEDGLAQLEQS